MRKGENVRVNFSGSFSGGLILQSRHTHLLKLIPSFPTFSFPFLHHTIFYCITSFFFLHTPLPLLYSFTSVSPLPTPFHLFNPLKHHPHSNSILTDVTVLIESSRFLTLFTTVSYLWLCRRISLIHPHISYFTSFRIIVIVNFRGLLILVELFITKLK